MAITSLNIELDNQLGGIFKLMSQKTKANMQISYY